MRDDEDAGKKTIYLVLTFVGIIALCVAFYVEFDGASGGGGASQAATPVVMTPTPAPADGSSAPPEPPKYLGLTLEQYLDKLDSFGDHYQEKADFSKSVVHEHVDWKAKVYSKDTNSAVMSVVLLGAGAGDKEYRVTACFNKPDAMLNDRIHLLQRGDTVRVTGVINADDIHNIDADNLAWSN